MIWLLTITLAGTPYRWASQPCAPLQGTAPIPHEGGLAVDDFEEDAPLLEVTPEQRSVALSLRWPGLASLIAAGHSLTTARAELSRWTEGDDYDDKETLIKGRLTTPQYGGDSEEMTCSLEESPYSDTSVIPPIDASVWRSTWPSAPDSNMGKPYPQIAGLPGHLTGRTSIALDFAGSTGILVTPAADRVLIAGHGSLATQVRVFDSSGASALVNTTEMLDGLDRLCTVVDLTASGLILGEMTYGISWPLAGGMPAPDGGELQYAGDVILHALHRSSLRVDWPQVRAACARLNWLVVVVDREERASSWSWVAENILPLLPVSAIPSGEGLQLIVWDFDATAEQAVYHLHAGPGVVRQGLVSYEKDDTSCVNECIIRYGYSSTSQDFAEYAVVTAEPQDDRETSCLAARLSVSALKDPELEDDGYRSETIEAKAIASERAAIQVALWRVNALSRSPRIVKYWLAEEVPAPLGAVWLLTDTEIALDSHIALIQGRILSDRGDLTLSLLVL